MKTLLIHSDYLRYEVKKKAIEGAEKIEKEKERVENALVSFIAVEKVDEQDPGYVVRELVKEIKEMKERTKAERIVLYPYAHLSSSLGSPGVAKKILAEAYEKLKGEGYEVAKSPFGWYKGFEIKCKGHPLSELSREIVPLEKGKKKEEKESQAVKAEKKLKSEWYILDTEGNLTEVGKFDFSQHKNLKKFSYYEKEKVRAVKETPPHVKIMRELELVDYEPASDPGNLRYYPKGRLMKSLLEEYVTREVITYGGVEVETPIMYDMEHPTLAKYLNRFPARQYTIRSDDKDYFLRFAACFGQFLMAKDATISYRNLPLKLYEMTRYSFRREKSGELTGLRRLRAFTMPDVHAICEDLDQAREEFKRRFQLCLDVQKGAGLERDDFELAIRVTKDFYDKNKGFVHSLVKKFGKPALLEMWQERVFYFILKYELNFVDALDKASALSTDQIDVENGERYGIEFTDREGKKKNPLILHCSPSGAIERVMYALLEREGMKKRRGETPEFPLWLSPTQVRLIPVADEFMDYSEEILKELEENCIRVDLDDRDESVSRKIRDGEKEWIPYLVVIGEKEKSKKTLAVRIRKQKEQKEMRVGELVKEIKSKTEKMPFKKLPLPKLISQRVKFV